MKNKNKIKSVIKSLAENLGFEFDASIPVTVLPNNDIVYKDFLIKQTDTSSWDVIDVRRKEVVSNFFLKTCALVAAKAYNDMQFGKYNFIKTLDRRYQSQYCDTIVYKHNIKNITDHDHRAIVLNKLEESQARAKEYQHQISILFKVAFCINTI